MKEAATSSTAALPCALASSGRDASRAPAGGSRSPREAGVDVQHAGEACRSELLAVLAQRVDATLGDRPGDDALLVLPTAPDIAPLLGTDADTLFRQRLDVMALTSYANLSGQPQVSLPVATRQGCPLGLSLIGPRGSDRALLEFSESFARSAGF